METEQEQESPSSLPLKMLLFGFLLVFAGIVLIMASALSGGDGTVSGGAIIFVGPIPIIFGAGPDAFLMIVLATALTIVGFILYFWTRKKFPKS